jgi:hypothetical protein
MANKLVDLKGYIKAETEKAYLFSNDETSVWLPKSQCQWDDTDNEMTMPEWLAKDKELI